MMEIQLQARSIIISSIPIRGKLGAKTIKQYPDKVGDIVWLAEKCDADPNCLAYNQGGWLKSEVLPESEWIDINNNNPLSGVRVKIVK